MTTLENYQMLIDNKWVDSHSKQVIESDNPYTTKAWAQIPRGNKEDADMVANAAHEAFTNSSWSSLNATQRGAMLRRFADLIAEEADQLAEVEVRDNGKLLSEMRAQLHYLPQIFHYYAGLADKLEGEVLPSDKAEHFNFTRHEALGVVLAITPWNSPLMIAAWVIAPALAAGNTVIIKPSEFASSSTLAFAKIAAQIFPAGVVNVVTGYGHEIGAALVSHPKVAKIAYTGGHAGARQVNEAAASQFKPTLMELGGKSPNIIFADANIDNAVNGVIAGIFAAAGQSCIAGSRLLVQDSIHDQVVTQLVDSMKHVKLGDPTKPETQIGPVANKQQLEKVLNYIQIAKDEGAKCVLGGNRIDAESWFVAPTIFTGVNNQMRIAQEEVFGPILTVIPFKDDAEALQIANDTPYGLAAGVWTQDMRRALKMSEKLQAGTVWVNTYRTISFMSPFGGYKQSGIGRVCGQKAIHEFLQTKSVWISTETTIPNPFVIRV